MNPVVIDSGIFIASVFPESLTVEARGLLNQLKANQVVLNAPALLHYELVAVARKAVYQGRVTPEVGLLARDTMLSYPVILHFNDTLLKRAYEIAAEHNRPTAYDSQYLALMELLSCDFWTADERLFNAVKSKMSNVHWLGNWKP